MPDRRWQHRVVKYFELRQGCVACIQKLLPEKKVDWTATRTAAALLCKGWYWPNSYALRYKAPQNEVGGGGFKNTETRFNPESGEVWVIFYITGDPQHLLWRRLLFDNCELYIEPQTFKKKVAELMEIVGIENKKAQERIGAARGGVAVK